MWRLLADKVLFLIQKPTMKNAALVIAIAFLTGCAAPPPVKIASKLLGRGVAKEARNELTGSNNTQTLDQQ